MVAGSIGGTAVLRTLYSIDSVNEAHASQAAVSAERFDD
jgi:hypothetical protein